MTVTGYQTIKRRTAVVNQERLVNEFCKLVSIDSTPFKERQMADYLKEQLTILGFKVFEDNAGEFHNGNSGNIYGYLKGTIAGDPILFSSHMDTVEPGNNKKAIIHDDGRITSDGTTVLGADNFSGLVSILEAIKAIQDQNIPHRDIEILFPIAEEVYLRGSEVFDYNLIKAKEAYVLDLSGPVGLAALRAPSLISFNAKIIGKAAHAGFAPEKGIHAIAIAADAISKLKQGRIDQETTVNVGKIQGGLAGNIVPEHCSVIGEIRSLNHNKALEEIDNIKNVFIDSAQKYHGICEFETSLACTSYEVSIDDPVVKRYIKACDELGYKYDFTDTFGGSDNNNFMLNNITGIVLACGMNEVHSLQEYTEINELKKICNIVIKLMICEENL